MELTPHQIMKAIKDSEIIAIEQLSIIGVDFQKNRPDKTELKNIGISSEGISEEGIYE